MLTGHTMHTDVICDINNIARDKGDGVIQEQRFYIVLKLN